MKTLRLAPAAPSAVAPSAAPDRPGRVAPAPRPGPELTIVVPTFNERDNVAPLVRELSDVLTGIEWEVIFVDDDSTDGTSSVVRSVARDDARVRCVQRIGRRGLSSACVEGMLASSSPWIAVMDGDLQHDPAVLPTMLETLRTTDADLVVGSRYVEGGSSGEWSRGRQQISRLATRLGYAVAPAALKDPMSGYFVLSRRLLDEVVHSLSGLGFKILLDIFASAARPIAFREVPFVFRSRRAGDSKLDTQVVWEYLMLLADKLVGRYVPVRFLAFGLVGMLGIAVHLAIVTAAYRGFGTDFVVAQTIATVVAMVSNYTLNNALTYRDRRRRGVRWLTGLLSFLIVCSVGAVANVGVAAYVFDRQSQWVVAALAGILVSAIWNYAVSGTYTWGRGARS
jgi:dolichol-phosphate mannosyltransferase